MITGVPALPLEGVNPLTVKSFGCVNVTDNVAVHPALFVAVTVYVPAVIPLKS